MNMRNSVVNTIKVPQIKCNKVVTPIMPCPCTVIKTWKKRLKDFK